MVSSAAVLVAGVSLLAIRRSSKNTGKRPTWPPLLTKTRHFAILRSRKLLCMHVPVVHSSELVAWRRLHSKLTPRPRRTVLRCYGPFRLQLSSIWRGSRWPRWTPRSSSKHSTRTTHLQRADRDPHLRRADPYLKWATGSRVAMRHPDTTRQCPVPSPNPAIRETSWIAEHHYHLSISGTTTTLPGTTARVRPHSRHSQNRTLVVAIKMPKMPTYFTLVTICVVDDLILCVNNTCNLMYSRWWRG